MKYPEEVLTKDKKGNFEVRNLLSRGEYVLYDYRDVKTFRQVESNKKKLYLKHDNEIEEYYIIPLKDGKSLLIEPKEKEEKTRKVWNDRKKKPEELF